MPPSRIARVAIAGLAAAGIAAAQTSLTGRVVDQNDAPVANARISARRGSEAPIETHSGPSGTFVLALSAPDTYLVNVDRAGYFALKDRSVQVSAGSTEVTLVVNQQKEVFQSVTVGEQPTPIDPQQTQREQRLSGTEINDIPFPASHSLRNSMRLIPGVIQDPTGGLHFHGGAEYQTQYTLDGFDITDPIDGRFRTVLAVEGVQSLGLRSSRESPEYGRGSAGALQIHTDNGTDQFRYTATNFIPGVSTQGGLRIGDWTPRAGISGPLLKGRAWFSDSFNGEYNSGFVNGLSSSQNTNPSWIAGNLFHAQVNLTASNILYADLLADFDHQAHFGLGVFDPYSTTTALSDHEWLAAVKDQHSWYGGTTLEVGFAVQAVQRRRTPLGDQPYIIAPQGHRGNYFANSNEHGRRVQLFTNFFPRAFSFWGKHQLQIGADAQRLDYTALFRRTSFDVVGLNGLPLFVTSFQGSGRLDRPNAALASYLNDHWQPVQRLAIDLGVREDWDELVRQAALGPRVSLAFAPFADARTKLVAGYALLHDPTNLALFSRPQDQVAVTTPYSAQGMPETPLLTVFVPGQHLKFPRYDNWSAGAEHDFGHHIDASLEWLRKRGRDGFVYAPESGIAPVNLRPINLAYGAGGIYQLTNLRRDVYDEVALTVKQTFGDQYGWLASYVRSRALSNAVLDVSVDQPLQLLDTLAHMPWDAPNRVLAWGYFPLPFKNWAIAFLADYRTGFPFAVTDFSDTVVGPIDSHRFLSNFDFNLHIERRFVFRGYRFALRVGANNLTDSRNPTAAGTVIGSPQYLQFFGDEGRHFVVRIRMFGRARQ